MSDYHITLKPVYSCPAAEIPKELRDTPQGLAALKPAVKVAKITATSGTFRSRRQWVSRESSHEDTGDDFSY